MEQLDVQDRFEPSDELADRSERDVQLLRGLCEAEMARGRLEGRPRPGLRCVALGKPVWILLPFLPDWRWLMRGSDSPWYASARLFRQERPDDWTAPVDRIVEELQRA